MVKEDRSDWVAVAPDSTAAAAEAPPIKVRSIVLRLLVWCDVGVGPV